jgi:hypothetical protein
MLSVIRRTFFSAAQYNIMPAEVILSAFGGI